MSDWRDRFLGFVDRPPDGWRPRTEMLPVGYDSIPPFVHESGLCVCISIDPSPSGEWLHVSVSMRDRLPRWPEVVRARDAFLGPTVPCVHAVPDSRDHRNYHPYCLHLWARADGTPVIDPTLAEYVAPRSA